MMSRSEHYLLFREKDLRALIDAYETEIIKEVEGWERNKILATSESDLVAYLVEKFTLDPPRLLPDQRYIESEGETRIDVSGRFEYGIFDRSHPHYVSGSYVTISIPFEGDGDFFRFQASTFASNPPRGRISESEILISFQDVRLDAHQTRQAILNEIDRIEHNLNYVKNDCNGWNGRVQSLAEQCVRDRKQRILEQADMVKAIGLPLKRRENTAATAAIPIVRKKRKIDVPSSPKETFKPEPELSDAQYNDILEVIDNLSISIERNPSTFVHLEEQQIRDLILVSLNGLYEGGATGETFNAQGKTDILIRADGRNVFIAECKFWSGPKAMHAAIEQILGYLTWRDTKAALVIFSKNADFTNVLNRIEKTIPQHPNFKRKLRKVNDTHTRYSFRQKNDPGRDIYLAVQAFNIPKRAPDNDS